VRAISRPCPTNRKIDPWDNGVLLVVIVALVIAACALLAIGALWVSSSSGIFH
jgi:hypothetical protein